MTQPTDLASQSKLDINHGNLTPDSQQQVSNPSTQPNKLKEQGIIETNSNQKFVTPSQSTSSEMEKISHKVNQHGNVEGNQDGDDSLTLGEECVNNIPQEASQVESNHRSNVENSSKLNPVDKYSHLHSLLMSNLSEMKTQFENLQKKFEEKRASRVHREIWTPTYSARSSRFALNSSSTQTQPTESKEKHVETEEESPFQSSNKDITSKQLNETPSTKSEINVHEVTTVSSSEIEVKEVKDESKEVVKDESKEVVKTSIPSDTEESDTKRDDQNQKIQSLYRSLRELEIQLSAKSAIVEELSVQYATSQEIIQNQEVQLKHLKQVGDKSAKRIQRLENKKASLKSKLSSLKEKQQNSDGNYMEIITNLTKENESLKKELQDALTSLSKLSSKANNENNDNIDNNQKNTQCDSTKEESNGQLTESNMKETVEHLLKTSPILQMDIPIDEIREENLNLYEIIRGYEIFLETVAEKVQLHHQAQQDMHHQKELALNCELQELQFKLKTLEKEKDVLETRFNKALTLLQLVYDARAAEVDLQEQYLPLLMQENMYLIQKMDDWESNMSESKHFG